MNDKRINREPHEFQYRILLMVTGRTPQVVTETLYALCVKQDPPFIPSAVHLITTAEGAQDARLALLAPDESNREFFYPTPHSRPLFIDPLKRYFDAADALVTLADIPFVRLRNSLPSRFKTLEHGVASFTEVVSAMQQALEPPIVRVDYSTGRLYIADGRFVSLSGADLAFYGWLARRQMASADPVRIPSKDTKRWKPEEEDEYKTYLGEYEAEARRTDVRDGTGIELRAVTPCQI